MKGVCVCEGMGSDIIDFSASPEDVEGYLFLTD